MKKLPKLSEKLTEAERKLEEVRTESDKTQGRHEKECRELSSQTKTLKGEKAATRRSASAWRTEDLASQIRNASESVALPITVLKRSWSTVRAICLDSRTTIDICPEGLPIGRPRTAFCPCPLEGPGGVADAGAAASDD